MEPLVSVGSLVKRFGSNVALDGVDLDVAKGEVFGLVGPNGAGKTSLIRCIVGASRPTDGSVRVLGLDPIAARWSVRRHIGYMPQLPALYLDLTVRRNVEFFSAAHSGNHTGEVTDAALETVELSHRSEDPVRTLSGGMRQRVSLACALANRPELLILDEPTAGVDPELRAAFWRTFRDLASGGTTIVVSTHQMAEALGCDRVAVMRAGRVIASDNPRALFRSNRATLRIWRTDGSVETVDVDDYPARLPKLSVGAARVEVELEGPDDIVLQLIREASP